MLATVLCKPILCLARSANVCLWCKLRQFVTARLHFKAFGGGDINEDMSLGVVYVALKDRLCLIPEWYILLTHHLSHMRDTVV